MSDYEDDFSRGGQRRSDRRRKPAARPPRASSNRRKPPEIRRVAPRTSTSETARQAQKRRAESSRIVTPEARKRRRRRTLTIVAVVVAVVLLAGAGAAFAWYQGLSREINAVFGDTPTVAGGELQAPKPGKPFYMVIIGVDTRPGEKVARSDTLVLAYVDPGRKRVTTMSIPRDTKVTIRNRGTAKINEAMQLGGPKKVIETVKDFTGLPITHYAYINFNGFKDIVDAVGGVDVYVPVTIDDIQASGNHPSAKYIRKGQQHLDGMHALTFVRARHQFADQDFTRMKNQQTFMKALAKRAMGVRNPATLAALANSAAKNINTDLQIPDIIGMALNFRGMDDKMFQSVTMPGHATYSGGVSWVEVDKDEFANVVAKMRRGELFQQVAPEAVPTTATVKPSSISINVRNGAGSIGLAKTVGDKLTKDGFKVKDTANMGQYVYGTTLVIYRSDKDIAKATIVREELGVGDVILSRGMYAFDADIMIVIGKDFDPQKFGTTKKTRPNP